MRKTAHVGGPSKPHLSSSGVVQVGVAPDLQNMRIMPRRTWALEAEDAHCTTPAQDTAAWQTQ
jgi:hypothetical protein